VVPTLGHETGGTVLPRGRRHRGRPCSRPVKPRSRHDGLN
jgi:hypothetical protein